VLTRISRAIKELGFLDAVLYAIERGLVASGGSARLYRYAFVAQPVPDGPLLPPRRGRSIDVRIVDARDPVLLKLELTSEVLDYRANLDSVCFAAFEDGEIIGCLWLCLGPYDEDEVRCRFTHRPHGATCWDYGIYVLPEKRSGFAGALAANGPAAYPVLAGPMGMRFHVPGIFARLGLIERITLTPEGIDHAAHRRLTRSLLAQGCKVFCFTYHSLSLEPGHTPYVRDRDDLAAFLCKRPSNPPFTAKFACR